MNDSHYIPNPNNAHIDTSSFERKVHELIDGDLVSESQTCHTWEKIFRLIESNFQGRPDEPNDEQLICRYFSTEKFIWFISKKSVFFGRANQFLDVRDSLIPDDYNNSVLKVLCKYGIEGKGWDNFIHGQQGRWLISCWTRIENHFDDNLLWHGYAGGPDGVGVTVRYGVLRDHFNKSASTISDDSDICCGNVAYGSRLLMAPFNKRQFFRNENEVRFVLRSDKLGKYELNIESIWGELGLRLSPEAPQHHVEAVHEIWRKYGGKKENVHIAGA